MRTLRTGRKPNRSQHSPIGHKMAHKHGIEQSGMGRMEHWNDEIAQLERRIGHLANTATQDYQKHVVALRNNLERARNRIIEVRSNTGTDDTVRDVERLLRDTRRVLDEYDNGNEGWAEGLAMTREHDSEGWSEGQGTDLPERDSEGWAEGMGRRQADSEGWSEGMSERSKRDPR